MLTSSELDEHAAPVTAASHSESRAQMRKTIAAILMALTLGPHVVAQGHESNVSTVVVGMTGPAGPRFRPATRELERLAKTADTQSGKTQRGTGGHHPVLVGAAIGAGAGFLINATACRTGESICTGAGNVLVAGIGAAIGAAVGALVSR
jgi:hypothetical protein